MVVVEVGLYRCASNGSCQLLGTDEQEVKGKKNKWKKTKFHFHDIDTEFAPGDRIEVRVAVLDDSDDHAWFAFGTDDYDSHIDPPEDGARHGAGLTRAVTRRELDGWLVRPVRCEHEIEQNPVRPVRRVGAVDPAVAQADTHFSPGVPSNFFSRLSQQSM